MKKINKKISLISIVSILTVSSVGYIGYEVNRLYSANNQSLNSLSSKNNNFFNENKDILFNNKNYLNVADATNQLLASDQVKVEDNLYIGDLSNAIMNTNNYDMVNTNKLNPYDVLKLKKAYKTSLGTYTKNYDDAKKTMIGSKEVKYMDYEFNQYHSEARAKDAIVSKTNSIPKSYYKIYDPVSNKDVNINPLNKDDQNRLKQIAVNSVVNLKDSNGNNNNFSIQKYYVNQANKNLNQDIKYIKGQESDWITSENKNEIYSDLIKNIYDNLFYALIFEVQVEPVISRKTVKWDYFGPKEANVEYGVSYDKEYKDFSFKSNNDFKNVSLKNLAKDILIFKNYKNFTSKFDIGVGWQLSYGNVFAQNAKTKANEKTLGYNQISISYCGTKVNPIHATHNALPPNAVRFFQNPDEKDSQKWESNVTFKLKFIPKKVNSKNASVYRKYFDDIMCGDVDKGGGQWNKKYF